MLKQTIGQYRVGSNFNPSGNTAVDTIKSAAASFIDAVEELADDAVGNAETDEQRGEIRRLKALAMTHAEDAAMWGVKAVTKRPNGQA